MNWFKKLKTELYCFSFFCRDFDVFVVFAWDSWWSLDFYKDQTAKKHCAGWWVGPLLIQVGKAKVVKP